MPREAYIGVSGMMLAPKVYLGIGISGQMQHMVGVNRAGTMFAVNKDKNAPMFKQCDYGLVGDLEGRPAEAGGGSVGFSNLSGRVPGMPQSLGRSWLARTVHWTVRLDGCGAAEAKRMQAPSTAGETFAWWARPGTLRVRSRVARAARLGRFATIVAFGRT